MSDSTLPFSVDFNFAFVPHTHFLYFRDFVVYILFQNKYALLEATNESQVYAFLHAFFR